MRSKIITATVNDVPINTADAYRLLDIVPIPMLVGEESVEDGKVISEHKFFNQKFLQIVGYTLTDIPDMKAWHTLAYPDAAYRQEVIDNFEREVQRAQEYNHNLVTTQSRVRCKDGTDRWFEFIGEIKSSLAANTRVVAMQEITALKNAMQELDAQAQTDVLTGLLNRRGMLERFKTLHAQATSTGEPFSLIICDIDKFKRVNDLYGHHCGDYVLVHMAGLLLNAVHSGDFVARWGGEEYSLLLPQTDVKNAMAMAEKIHQQVVQSEFIYPHSQLQPTMTMGVVQYHQGESIDDTIRRADRALYYGKTHGRNCIAVSQQDELMILV